MASGGYRYSAGRPAHRARIENVDFIDADRWRRMGLLDPCEAGSVYAHNPRASAMTYSTSAADVLLGLVVDGKDVEHRIGLVRKPLPFGGERVWFRCPACDDRRLLLYLRDSGFQCRACAHLSYPSQRDNAVTRAWRRIGLYPPAPVLRPTW